MPSWKKVILSGSDAALNSLNVTTSLTASGIIYPTTDGTSGQVVITDGNGNLSFSNVENTAIIIKNMSGGTIAKGTPCYITGSGNGGNMAGVFPADASNPLRMPAGVIAGETLIAGAEGIGLINGFINGVDTSAFNAGDSVYVAVGGGYTNIKPTGSSVLIQKLGNVEKSHASNGSGVINGPGYYNEVPNIQQGYTWVGDNNGVAVAIATSSIQNVVSSSYAINAGNTSTIDVGSFSSNVDSYLLMSNVIGTTGVGVGGDSDLKYNAFTNKLTVGNITAITGITGSLLGTASFATSASVAVSSSQATTASFALNATSASFTTSASFATTASYAANGGVTQIVAGTNVSISPTNGLGAVTINSTAASSGGGTNTTASFSNSSTWTFTHNLNSQYVIIQTVDSNSNQIIPQNITLTDNNTATITFPTNETGIAIASLGGVGTSAATASYVNTLDQNVNITGNTTASIFYATNNGNGTNFRVGDDAWIGDINALDTLQIMGQQNSTRGYIKFGNGSSNPIVGANNSNTLTISGSLTVGTNTESGSTENTLNVYPPLGAGAGEGGQILVAAPGGTYTSASMLDNWQNQFRILKGTNTGGSNAGLVYVNLHNGNTNFIGAVTASAYSGLPNSWLYATRNTTNQTIGSGTWANRDIIFNDYSSINFTYNNSTGIATLRANKIYRITARVAWLAGAVYTLQHRIYNQTTSAFVGPTAESVQATQGSNNISDATLEFIFAVGGTDTDISIKTTPSTNGLTGEQIRSDLNTQLIIQQIA